jgi:hypothetical protein
MPKTNSFVKELKRALTERRVVSRKMSSVARQCGRLRLTNGFLGKLEQDLQRAGIHTDRELRSTSTLPKHSVKFSLHAFSPSEVEFGREQQLVDLIVHSIGKVHPLLDLKIREREYGLPSGRSVDLLCEEVNRAGKGDLVAVEFKKGQAGAGAAEQLTNYLTELRGLRIAEGRTVRGIILARQITSSLNIQPVDGSRIDMYEYKFTFNRVGAPSIAKHSAPVAPSTQDQTQSNSMAVGQ